MSEKSKAGRGPYPPEVRERAVRMVFDHQDEYPSQWKAIESIAGELSINHETLRIWVRRGRDRRRPASGVDHRRTEPAQGAGKGERRAAPGHEILKAASAFFARELDP
jgi:transposase